MLPAPSHRLAAALGAASLAAYALALRAGSYVGLSNDDAARTLIAWDFARAPSLDPTRSSWLPAHTYVLGALLRAFPSLDVTPVALSLAAGLASCALAAACARALGAGPWGALAAALGAGTWRWTALTAAGTGLPEMPCVALLLGAVAALAARRVALAGALVALACGHRYEAWFAAAALVAVEALRPGGRRAAAALAAWAAVVPLAWLAINHARAGDALDFVRRVEAYRGAEGALAPLAARLVAFPWALAREAPVLVALALGGLCLRDVRRAAWGCVAPALAVLAALVVAEGRGGGATHHAARALLPVAWLLAPVAGVAAERVAAGGGWRRAAAVVAVAAMVASGAAPRSDTLRGVNPEAVRAGRAVADALRTRAGTRWLVELARQDFLWVEVASGAPERAVPDRRYGAAAPTEPALDAALAGVDVAAVSSPQAAAACARAGLRPRWTERGWSVFAR